ncbi:MAG: hypothetical protein WBE34_09135 [Candidatus Nitrosopolaris sp.]
MLKALPDDDVSELCNKAALSIKIVKIVKIDQPNLSDTSLCAMIDLCPGNI